MENSEVQTEPSYREGKWSFAAAVAAASAAVFGSFPVFGKTRSAKCVPDVHQPCVLESPRGLHSQGMQSHALHSPLPDAAAAVLSVLQRLSQACTKK